MCVCVCRRPLISAIFCSRSYHPRFLTYRLLDGRRQARSSRWSSLIQTVRSVLDRQRYPYTLLHLFFRFAMGLVYQFDGFDVHVVDVPLGNLDLNVFDFLLLLHFRILGVWSILWIFSWHCFRPSSGSGLLIFINNNPWLVCFNFKPYYAIVCCLIGKMKKTWLLVDVSLLGNQWSTGWYWGFKSMLCSFV